MNAEYGIGDIVVREIQTPDGPRLLVRIGTEAEGVEAIWSRDVVRQFRDGLTAWLQRSEN